ncbi:RNA polymerase II-associated protein 1-like isoform X2 [Acropora millepora]|nr:RNA polymerase II-associated protein 1-like isoform X2 [Acropora millepora]
MSGSDLFGVPEEQLKNLVTSRDERKKSGIEAASNLTAQFSKSSVISGEGLTGSANERVHLDKAIDEIHSENVARLEAMTKDEILEEQARIKASLDPSLVAFLTSRHKKCDNEEMETDTTAKEFKDRNVNCTSSTTNESIWAEKHVHFNDNVQVMTQENRQSAVSVNEQHGNLMSDNSMTIGNLKVSQKWLHMDTVETEKLEWMKDCTVPSAVDSKQGDQARFDFNGNLLSKTDSIPEYIGLHHHGNEPSAPGYTLEELFVLARSTFQQQRVFALQTLARIIKQDQQGIFESLLSEEILSVLLNAGILFLLRWALDDTSEAVIAVAVQGLAAVLIVPCDKDTADQLFSFPRGHEFPALRPVNEKDEAEKSSYKEDEEEKGLTDAQLLKQDAVKGLIQMNILPRLRYILEVCSPAEPTVNDILDVLTRISQHSTQAANEVLKCPRLIETIFESFLPLSWKMLDQTVSVHGRPFSTAMRLVRGLCCAGKHMTASLISKHKLLDRILRYTALAPTNMQLPMQEAFSLFIESLRTWKICVLYGLGCDAVREMYPFFMEHLQSIQHLSIFAKTPEEKSELCCASAIFGIVEAVIYAAGTAADQKAQVDISSSEGQDGIPPLALNWSHVTGFLPLIGGCVTKWIKEIMEFNDFKVQLQSESLCLVSGAIAALSAFYSLSPDQASHSPVEVLQQLENLTDDVLLPIINSEIMDHCFTQISSPVDARLPKFHRKSIPSLPGCGSLELVRKPANRGPTASVNELVGFTSSLLRLLCQVTKQHKGIASKFSTFLCKEAIIMYLKSVIALSEVSSRFFARQEHHLQYYLLKFAYNEVELTGMVDFAHIISLLHEVALLLFTKFLPGDEFYAHDLLSTVLLNSRFLRESDGLSPLGVTKDLSEMSLATPSMPFTYDTATATRGELVAKAHKNLPSISSMFVGSFNGTRRALATSRSLALHNIHRVQSFLLRPCTGPLQPADWMFLPIVDLHNQAVSIEMNGKSIDAIADHAVSTVTRTLQFVLMLEKWRPSCLRHVSMASRIARLMCVFLTGNDLFLNSQVRDYLSALLRIYTSPSRQNQLDFSSSIPGLTSFYDLFASFLAQFSAVSFGDPLFASFLIVPLTQRHDFKFRRAVWEEHVGVLRALSIPLDQLPLPLEEFLHPVEQNQSLLALYLRALATQAVRSQWSPLFYLVAVHHVNSFVFQRVDPADESALKRKIGFLKQVLLVQNEDVRRDILHYHKPSSSSSVVDPFEKFTNLPADRQLLLRNRDCLEDCRQMYETISSV